MELGAARLTVQLSFSPCCHTEPWCVLSCRFSGEPIRTVSALFLLLPPPPCLALAEAAWLGDVWLKERGREESAFLLHLDPRAWQGLGNGLPQFPLHALRRTQPLPSPSPGPGAVRLLLCPSQGWFCLRAQSRVLQVILALGAPGAPGTWELGSATRFLIQHP